MMKEVHNASTLFLWIGAIAVAAVGTALRCEHLATISFWFDESFTWKTISFPWSELLERVARDNQPPLYYVLLKLWAGVWGCSPLALRSFSVVAGMLTVWAVYLFVRDADRLAAGRIMGTLANDEGARMKNQPTVVCANLQSELRNPQSTSNARFAAPLAATLVALSPFQVQWALQARMYTLLAAVVALSSWLMVCAIARPRSLGRWAAFSVSAAAIGYTHYYGLFAVAAQFLFLLALLKTSRSRVRGDTGSNARPRAQDNFDSGIRNLKPLSVLMAAAGVCLAWVPWAPMFLRQLGQVHEAFWIRPLDWRMVATTIYEMFSYSQYDYAGDEVIFGVLELCVLLLTALVAGRATAIDRYVALAAALPFAASVTASSLGVRVFATHYFIAAHLFFLVATAVLVNRVSSAAVRALVASGLVAGSAVLCYMHWRLRDREADAPGALSAGAWLDGARRPGEPVIVCSPMIATTVAAHMASQGPVYVYRWPHVDYRHFEGTAVFDEDDYVTAGDLTALNGDSAWVINTDGWDNGSFTVPMPWPWVLRVEERFQVMEIYGDEYDLVIRLYQRGKERGSYGEAQEPARVVRAVMGACFFAPRSPCCWQIWCSSASTAWPARSRRPGGFFGPH